MTTLTEWLAVSVALLGVLSSSVIAYLVYRLTRQAQYAEMQREIGHLYEQLMDFRTAHPEVLRLSRRWEEACFAAIYRQASEEDKEWALYYTYTELCFSFTNAVLYGRKIHLLDRYAYEGHYRPLLKLLLTEHYPYVTSVVPGKYVSSFISDFVRELEKEGWDWAKMHDMLPGLPTEDQVS